jgi:hypothetical protein
MSFRETAPLFVFLDASAVDRTRSIIEGVFGLPIIENRFHPPHHHHGIIKYDAGPIIVSLNQAHPEKFDTGGDDGIACIFACPSLERTRQRAGEHGLVERSDGVFVDPDNHAFRLIQDRVRTEGPAVVVGLELASAMPQAALEFFRHGGWLSYQIDSDCSAVSAGPIELIVKRTRPVVPRHGFLTVLATRSVQATRERLVAAGFDVSPGKLSAIGWTATLRDPDGRLLCLYEPSPEARAWESGRKVASLMSGLGDPR